MINYQNLHDSQVFYSKYGFEKIEAPWTVTKAVADITKPTNVPHLEIIGKKKVLVGSAEQSFLYLYLKGFLPLGTYQAVTPCFREDSFDLTHSKYFMKNELIETKDTSNTRLEIIIDFCVSFFEDKLNRKVKVVQTSPESWDIEYQGLELGSYGIRECNFLKWIYATGCAEPRLSYIQNLIKNGRIS